MSPSLPKIVCIVGPTASGKTDLAIHLAKKFNGEIVSADSRQIYRGMDIGTAKPPISAMRRIPHYLIDIKNPSQSYTLSQFKSDALKSIRKIHTASKLPLLVGGTGLYISAIINNLLIPKVKPNRALRTKLTRLLEKRGLYYLYGKLTALDPEAAYTVDPKNPRRIIRALEICITTKKPLSHTRTFGMPLFYTLILGLRLPPENLEERIVKRTKAMFRNGLVEEVKKLVKNYGRRSVPFDAIGYREIIEHLDGKITLEEAEPKIIKNTWRFAKRQLTWFKKMPVKWINDVVLAEAEIKTFLQKSSL